MGVICQPFFVANHATELITVSSQVHCKNNLFTPPVLGLLPLPASFLTLGVICIDRLLTLTLHMRYKMIVTIHRVLLTIFPCLNFSHNHCHTKVLGKKVAFRIIGDSRNNIYCNTLTEAH